MLERVRRRRLTLPESGIEIALLDWGGEGPLALLHHANGFCAATWGLVAEPLSRHFHVVAMDARGHGDSSKPDGAEHYRWEQFGRDLRAVGEALAAEHSSRRIALGLGHSFGGTSTLMAAAERPELFERIVLVDPVVPPPPNPDPVRRARTRSLVDAARNRQNVWPSRRAAREKWAGKDLFAAWDPRALDLYVQEGMADRPDGQVELKCAGEVEASIFESAARLDIWPVAERVRTPALLLWAVRGDFPRIAYEHLTERMGDAQVRDVPAGHLVPMERPDLVLHEVLSFTGAAQDSTG